MVADIPGNILLYDYRIFLEIFLKMLLTDIQCCTYTLCWLDFYERKCKKWYF